jgi:hypothetical protein
MQDREVVRVIATPTVSSRFLRVASTADAGRSWNARPATCRAMICDESSGATTS